MGRLTLEKKDGDLTSNGQKILELLGSGRFLEGEILVGKLYNTPYTVVERTRLFPSYGAERLAAAVNPGVALEKGALREAGAESASAAEGKESPSLKRQKWESDFEKAKRLSIEYDKQLKIIWDRRKEVIDEIRELSLTGMEETIAKDLHEAA